MVIRFVDDHRDRFGVAPICRVLSKHDVPIAPSTYYTAKTRPAAARTTRDEQWLVEIERVFRDRERGRGVAGVRKVWHLLRRDTAVVDRFGPVARCTVERLMRRAGLQGARRGRRFVTTKADTTAPRPPDLVRRDFTAESVIGLYKTECVRHESPFSTVELATLGWVHWFNTARLQSALDYLTPIEFEQDYYRQNKPRQQTLPGQPALR